MPRVLITVSGKNAQPYRFSLERKVVRLGRAADNDIVIDDQSVSSHHCEMRRIQGGYILEDLSSTNGLKLDGDRMEIVDLVHGKQAMIGDAALDFELSGEERDSLGDEDFTPQQRAKLPPARKPGSEDSPGSASSPPKKQVRPPSAKPYAAATLPGSSQKDGALNFLITVVFLVLAALSFYLGLHIQHHAKTGNSLWGDMKAKDQTEEQ